jgi:hypothetical protein
MPRNSLSSCRRATSDADPASAPAGAVVSGIGATEGGEPTLLSQMHITGPPDLDDTC